MKGKLSRALSIAVLLCTTGTPAAARTQEISQAKPLAFAHVAVIDTTGGPAKSDFSVIVRDGRIAEVGPSAQVRIPQSAQIIEARGKFLIPGLWDMHAHALAVEVFPLFVANGVTGVRIMWGIPRHHQLRREFESGARLGPRMVIASAILDGPNPVWPGSVAIHNEAEAREAVRRAKKEGAEFIKVYNLLSRDAYFAIVDEARKLGLPVAGHVPWSVSVREVSDAGQKSVEHLRGTQLLCPLEEANVRRTADAAGEGEFATALSRLRARRDAECLATYDQANAQALFAQLAKNGTWLVPTLTVSRSYAFLGDEGFRDDARLKYVPADRRQAWRPENNRFRREFTEEDWSLQKKLFPEFLKLVGKMQRAGVEILAGTDTANPYCFPGFSLHDELALLVEAGLTPMEALQAATLQPARFLGRERDLGTVEKDKLADLVLLDANPLEEIRNTQKIAGVVYRGKWFSRAQLDEILKHAEVWASRQ